MTTPVKLQYPLPAWLPADATLSTATRDLKELLQTKPARAHALRTILAKISALSLDKVPGSADWRDFERANGDKPMTTWGVPAGNGATPRAPSLPTAPEPRVNRFLPRVSFAPPGMSAREAEEFMRAIIESMEAEDRANRGAFNPARHPSASAPQAPARPQGPDLTPRVERLEQRYETLVDRAGIVDMIERAIAEHVANVRHAEREPVRVVVQDGPKGKTRDMGVQHEKFPLLLKMVAARGTDGYRLNIWLPGPAGSGKTRAAMEVAKALAMPFRFCGALDSAYALLGFTDATGGTVRTQFREAYEHGGVFLFDEVDASDPSAVLALNAALANGHCAFPDKVVERHKDCCIIAAANTWGHGGTFEYVGRLKQDAAFLSRFVVLPWPYDEKLERAISPDEAWAEFVQRVRANVAHHKIAVVISPRATTNGAALLAAGIDREDVINATLRSGMDDATWARVS